MESGCLGRSSYRTTEKHSECIVRVLFDRVRPSPSFPLLTREMPEKWAVYRVSVQCNAPSEALSEGVPEASSGVLHR